MIWAQYSLSDILASFAIAGVPYVPDRPAEFTGVLLCISPFEPWFYRLPNLHDFFRINAGERLHVGVANNENRVVNLLDKTFHMMMRKKGNLMTFRMQKEILLDIIFRVMARTIASR